LSASGPRLAFALLRANPQVVLVSRLPPLFVTGLVPWQFVAAVFARIVFFAVALSLVSL